MLVVHHDFTSLRSAVTVLRCQPHADAGGAIAFRGVDVLGIDTTVPVTVQQLEDFHAAIDQARTLGLDARPPTLRPPTVPAHLVTDLAHEHGLSAAWRHAVHVAYHVEGRDIGQEALLVELAESVGLPGDEVRTLLADRSRLAELRRRMLADRRRGVGGVPVLEFDGTLIPASLADDRLEELVFLSSGPRH